MVSNRRVGGGDAVTEYRHPLIRSISPFLGCLSAVPDARARRWTPLGAGIAAVLMALDPNCPLTVRCDDALACMERDFARRRRVGRTYNGLLKALERQSDAVLPALKTDLRRRALAEIGAIPRVAGWMLLAVDGSKEELPRTRDHEVFFGIADNGVRPQAFVTAVVEVHTGLPWDWRIGQGRSSERDHLIEMVPALPDEALILTDGDFVGYPVWSALHARGTHFLIRVGGNVSLLRDLWPDAAMQRVGDIVYAWPRAHREEVAPLRLRLIRVGNGGKPVYLLTNVVDPRRLSRRAAGEIYRRRWGIELFYRTLKRTLGYAKLRSRSGRRGRIELEWGLIALAIMTMLGIGALRRRRADPRCLSPAGLVRALRGSLLRGASVASLNRALAAAVRDDYTRHRPKQSRHRPVTRITPFPRRTKPPRVRRATREERLLALARYPHLAA